MSDHQPTPLTPASPLPWHVGPHYRTDVESGSGRVAETGAIGSPNGIRNAAYIVLAANAFPVLYEALKEIVSFYPDKEGAAWRDARAALALAEGREVTHG